MQTTFSYCPTFDCRLLAKCRKRVELEMIADGFQIGGKFDTVREKRARKLCRNLAA